MTFSITAKLREPGKAGYLREQGLLPAIVYGGDIEPTSVVVDRNKFKKVYHEAGSNLIDFTIEGKDGSYSVLIQDFQIDPVTREVSHVDFRQIPMGVEIHTEISLNLVGEAPAVKLGGTLITGVESLNIKCLPKDLVGEIDVDISVLKTPNDVISIADVKLPAGIEVLDNLDTVVAKVNAPLSEEQLKAMEETEEKTVEDIKVEGEKSEEAGSETEEIKE
jgi:large subunit ribosomal protein L25